MNLDEHDVIEPHAQAHEAEEPAPEVLEPEAAGALEEMFAAPKPAIETPTLPQVEAFMPRHEPEAEEIRVEPVVEASEPPRRELLLWPKSPSEDEAPAAKPAFKPAFKPNTAFRIDPLGLAASIAAIGFIAVGLFAGYDHAHQSAQFAAKTAENQELQKSIAGLKARIDAIEVARTQEQTAELHKTLAEIKTVSANAQGVTASVAQIGQRVDRLEKDQNARIDKLGDKVEQTTSNRYAEIVARLEKLEKKPPTVALAQPAPTPPQAKPSPSPSVANDITGSIDKSKTVLRGYVVDDVRGGVAYLESRDGPYTVSAGDVLPGAGRVLRIERRGPNWVVVTSQGVITSPEGPY